LCFAVPIVALVIALFYTWFAVLDRYQVFLYYHDMGPGFDTTPFGWVTVGRYWMSGLVAGGAVMVLYIVANLLLGRVIRSFRPPRWWRVWLLCAGPLLVAIPAIVMTVNDPVLPLRNAAQVTAVTLIGLALAMALGQVAARHPMGYLLLMIDGLGLACLLSALRSLEGLSGWLARGRTASVWVAGGVLALGIVLLLGLTALRWWLRLEVPTAASWLVAGLQVLYLLLPLYHLAWCSDDGTWTDPGYFIYISSSDNYFARSRLLQVGVWIGVALLAWGATRLRVGLQRRWAGPRERP
jgi:hypothetical protein